MNAMRNLTNNNTKGLRQASYDEMILPIHTLWCNNKITLPEIKKIFSELYDLEISTFTNETVIVYKPDGTMTHTFGKTN